MKKNILLIDNNKYLLDVFVIRLTMCLHNYRVLTARNARQGIEIMKSAPIEFALTDLDVPAIDGYHFVEYAKKHYPAVPVYAMSNNCSPELVERLRLLGFADCIEKPFLIEEVTYRIMNRLKDSIAAVKRDHRPVASS